jgi:hypothetical protein
MNKTADEVGSSTVSRKQVLFLRYFTATLIDLTVLNMFAEYWDRITITSFGISLLVAIALQVMLKLTIYFEDCVGAYFKSDASLKMKLFRILSAWTILFISKLIILEVLQFIFSDALIFSGPYHGLLAFIVLVATILFAELIIRRLYKALA